MEDGKGQYVAILYPPFSILVFAAFTRERNTRIPGSSGRRLGQT